MQNIFSHITYLLTKHECVIIPGFGALIHSPKPVNEPIEESIFSPPGISLGFNSELKHNDGILADSIKREQKISYNEANKIVSDFSVQLLESIKSKKEVTIPQVGRFILSEDNKTRFSPASDLSANAGQYGFKNFYLPLLSEIDVPVSKEDLEKAGDKHAAMIPLRKRLLTATSVAAIALIFLLLSIPIDNKEIPNQYAGIFSPYNQAPVIPVMNIPGPSANEEIIHKDIVPTEIPVQTKEDTIETIVSVKKEVVPETKSILPETNLTSAKINNNNPANRYLIIIASFPNKSDAEKMLPQFKKEFSDASIIEKSDRSRIYIRSFDDKEEAEYFLNKFRADNPKFKDAWLLSNKLRTKN